MIERWWWFAAWTDREQVPIFVFLAVVTAALTGLGF